MNIEQALNAADGGEAEGLRGLYPMAAQVLAAEVRELRDALSDCAGGLRYIRETHGELYGVGFDRALGKANARLGHNAALTGAAHKD